ncbi:MAG: hypothetical protein IJD59_02140 [Clostridia bacterium]|nr:hypothetical protein [Clostridia bacterium]
MSKIKIFISLFLIVAVACIPTVCSTPDSDGIMPLNLHTLHTVTSFGFVDHHAFVNVDFMGYEETADLRIDVRIEKQNFLLFRETVVSDSRFFQGESYHDEFFYPLYSDGIYDCTVTYTVMGKDGEDLITFHDTRTYRLSEHTEHTHVWNRERNEPTAQKEGLERKFCYCGQSETTVLEKLPYQGDSSANGRDPVTSLGASGRPIDSIGRGISTLVNKNAYGVNSYSAFGTQTQTCNCPFCELQRSMPKTTPTFPSGPSIPTIDPWKKQQEAYARSNNLNPYHINNSYRFK